MYKRPDHADEGYLMVLVIMILAILTITAITAVKSAITDSAIVRSSTIVTSDFYHAESALITSVENCGDWLDTLDNQSGGDNGCRFSISLNKGEPAVTVEAFRIQSSYSGNSIAENFSDFSRSLPRQAHIGPPPRGSGTGVSGDIMVRRFGLTATSADSDIQIQMGVFKYVPASKPLS